MSEFSVHRTADTIPALRYCLVLDGERIAGGKPDYRGNNHLISWSTRETYGPVDQLKAENAKLRELCADAWHLFTEHGAVHPCDLPVVDAVRDRMRELEVEVTP